VFVTSTTYTGDLGGLAGADTECQTHAQNAGLTGTFKAWLSDSTTSAAARLIQSPNPYILTSGGLIATSWTDLTDGTIAANLDADEFGNPVARNGLWTGTNTDGTGAANTCSNWTDGTIMSNGQSGVNDVGTMEWTEFINGDCSQLYHLICIAQ
jgi:hypothetical protein